MKTYRVTFKDKSGGLLYMSLQAKDKEDAQKQAERSQYQREARFPLTFARLEQAAATGNAGGLAIDPRYGGKALTEAWVKAETEKRKADQDRYDKGFTVVKVEERS